MSLNHAGVASALRIFGKRVETFNPNTDEQHSFKAIHDVENTLDTSSGVGVLIAGEVLEMKTSDAEQLTVGQALDVEGKTYYVREKLTTTDGMMTRVSVVTNKSECKC